MTAVTKSAFFASLAAMVLCYGYADSAEAEDRTNQVAAIYLTHPDDDQADRQQTIPNVAADLAKAFLTPKLAVKHEPVDVFCVPNADFEKFPEKAVKQLLETYRRRHSWKESIPLDVQSAVLDLTEPHRQIASVEDLATAVKQDQFSYLILGDDSEDSHAMAKSVMAAFFSEACLHTLVYEVGDGDQLQGYLLGTTRKQCDNNRSLIGLLIVWD